MKTISVFLLVLIAQISFSQNSDWIFRNPNPQNDFYGIKFFDQNTGYVVGSNGVILKNTTGSNNWINIPSGTTNNLYGLYFFDVNHGYVVGQGEIVMYTSNGGTSWISYTIPNGLAFRSISFINPTTGFVAGDSGSLYKTTIGIAGFTPINVTSFNLHSVFALDSLRVFACGDSGRFLKSTNGGTNWLVQTLNSNNLLAIYFTDALTGFISVYLSSSLRTTDGGVSWNPMGFYSSNQIYSFKFINLNRGLAVGAQGPIETTTNAGANWNQWCSGKLFGNYVFRDLSLVDTNTFFVCGDRGWVLKSVGTYQTQISTHIGGTKTNLSDIKFINENTGIAVGDNLFLNTNNGGTNWNVSLVGGNSWFESSSYITAAFLFPSGGAYRVFYSPGHASPPSYGVDNSTDGGITWNGNRSFGQTNAYFGGICEIEGVTYISYTSLFVGMGISKNSGSGWSSVYSSSYGLRDISFANQNTGIVIGGGSTQGVLHTTNGGINWIFVPTGNNHNINHIQMLNSGVGYLAGDSTFIMRTTNYGSNWALLSSGGDQNILDIKFASDNTGWYLGQSGNYPNYTGRFYYTTNGGTNFVRLQSLQAFNVRGFSFINAYTGFVSGDSGVVLKTTNGGLTFVNTTSLNVPDKFSLSQNYPNPFNPNTVIKFSIPQDGKRQTADIKIVIYNVLGREVATLINQQMQPGSYSVDWDGTNYPSGVYFYQLTVISEQLTKYSQTKRMVLIK